MNLRKIWTEIFQKPAGRLTLFLLVGGLFFVFILFRRAPSPKSENRPDGQQATTATAYSFEEDIPPTTRIHPPSQSPTAGGTFKPTVVTPKPPPPIPQAIFATKEPAHSESYLPYGRLLRCSLVNTVDSTNINTPIIGLVLEDVWHDGQLIIPAGAEVHGVAQKVATRERIGSDSQWKLVFLDGRELPIAGTVLDYAPDKGHPDRWDVTDGSAGLHGYLVQSDKLGEAKAILASMISAGAGAFPQMTNLISPPHRWDHANSKGRFPGCLCCRSSGWSPNLFSAALRKARQRSLLRPCSRRNPLPPLCYSDGGSRENHRWPFCCQFNYPSKMKFLGSILLLLLCSACAIQKAVDSNPLGKDAPATALPAPKINKVRTSETVKAYPVGRYTDPNFPDAMHERHTLYRREQSAQWDYRPSKPYALSLGPIVAKSNPSPSYYVKTNSEQMNA